jgi:hypothetical protein
VCVVHIYKHTYAHTKESVDSRSENRLSCDRLAPALDGVEKTQEIRRIVLGYERSERSQESGVRMAEIRLQHIHVSTLQIGSRNATREPYSGVSRTADHASASRRVTRQGIRDQLYL